MATTIIISIRLTRYSLDEFVAEIFGILRALYRAARRIYQIVAALSCLAVTLVKKVLIGILIVEIVGLTLIFIAGTIFTIF